MTTRDLSAAALLCAAALLAGCGPTVEGTPSVDSAAASAALASRVPAGLDVGSYPTTTTQPPPLSEDSAWVLEGGRMSEALIQVNEVDTRLKIGGAGLRSYPVLRGGQLVGRVPDATAAAFAKQKFKVGMTTTRGDDFDRPAVALRIGLYRFESDEEARRAFDAVKASQAAMRPIAITSTPGVAAAEFKPGTVDSYVVEGPFVINASGTAPTTEQSAAFVTKAYELEMQKIKAFSPTPSASILSLPTDKDGILARTLRVPGTGIAATLGNTYFGLPQVLHQIRNIDRAKIYQSAGVDLVAQGDAVVYRTRDAAAAKKMNADLLNPPDRDPAVRDVAAPAGLPDSHCTERVGANSFSCSTSAGRWAASAGGETLLAAQQRIAAQYALLAKNP